MSIKAFTYRSTTLAGAKQTSNALFFQVQASEAGAEVDCQIILPRGLDLVVSEREPK